MHNTEIVNVATSVDKQRGLFLIRNSSEGSVAYPIHVRKVLKEALWIVDVAVENAGASINVFVCGISASKIWWMFSGQPIRKERRTMVPMESRSHWRALLTKTCTFPMIQASLPPCADTSASRNTFPCMC